MAEKTTKEIPYWLDHNFLLNLLEQLPSHVFWKDKEGVYLGCNSTFARSFGLKPEDIIGKTDSDLPVKKEDSDNYREKDREVMSSLRPKLNIEEKQTLSDGREIFLLTSKVPLFDNDQKIFGILGVYSDITELKKTTEALEKAKRLAEAASQAKSDFISNMSHDLRTPITGILGVAQDLLNTAQESDAALKNDALSNPEKSSNLTQRLIHHVKNDSVTVINAVVPLINLCDEILETTRLGKNMSSLPPESFDAHELIEHNLALLRPTARNRKLDLIANIDKRVPKHIHGLRTYIDRTLINLISNALKFTEKGYVKVTMSLLEDAPVSYKKDDKVTLQISIEDTGIGIPEDKHETIFEHFSRLSASYKGIYKGYGLGLYTVKAYIKAMKGTIKVKSQPGKGTCFKITIPFIVADKADRSRDTSFSIPVESIIADAEPKTHPTLSAPFSVTTKANSTPSSKVLVVEDNLTAARALMAGIRPFNCDADIAENGAQAIEMAQNNSYDIIFMDVGLPDITGIEATKAIRLLSDTKKAQVPIVAITGHADSPKIRQQCLDAGMQGVFSKPARPLLLETAFQHLVFKNKDKEKFGADKFPVFLREKISGLPILDWKASEQICGGDRKDLNEILALLSPDLKVSAEIFAKAYSNKDIIAIRNELHRAISGVVYISAPLLETALKAFQKAIKTEPPDWNECDHLYNEMQEIIAVFRKEYEKGEV